MNFINTGKGNTVQVNGKTYNLPPGKGVSIINNKIYVDGKEWVEGPQLEKVQLEIFVTGDLISLESYESVNVYGNVHGGVTAGGSVQVTNSVGGKVVANGSVSCGDVNGDVRAGGSVSCDNVSGNVDAGGSVSCDDIGGTVTKGRFF